MEFLRLLQEFEKGTHEVVGEFLDSILLKENCSALILYVFEVGVG